MYRVLVLTAFLVAPSYLIYLVLLYFRTKVPYIVTPTKRLAAIVRAMHLTPDTIIYDLGCGKGDILFAAEKFGAKKLVGYELSPLHAWYARAKAWALRSQVHIRRQDFFLADIVDADIIYLFLVQSAVEALWSKIKIESKSGAKVMVLCNQFTNVEPTEVILLDEAGEKGNGAKLYVYMM